MGYIRFVRGEQKEHAVRIKVLINDVEYISSDEGVIQVHKPGIFDIEVDGKHYAVNVVENDSVIVEL